jgi:hypothetical protein
MQIEVYLSAALDVPGWIRVYASPRGRDEFERIFGVRPDWFSPKEGYVALVSPEHGKELLYGWATFLMGIDKATTIEEAESCLEKLDGALREQGCWGLIIGPTRLSPIYQTQNRGSKHDGA